MLTNLIGTSSLWVLSVMFYVPLSAVLHYLYYRCLTVTSARMCGSLLAVGVALPSTQPTPSNDISDIALTTIIIIMFKKTIDMKKHSCHYIHILNEARFARNRL